MARKYHSPKNLNAPYTCFLFTTTTMCIGPWGFFTPIRSFCSANIESWPLTFHQRQESDGGAASVLSGIRSSTNAVRGPIGGMALVMIVGHLVTWFEGFLLRCTYFFWLANYSLYFLFLFVFVGFIT